MRLAFWRKRNEGFEWREYVRTTILVRRHERRQKIHDVKDAAVFGVKKAGKSSWNILADGAWRAGELGVLGAITFFDAALRVSRRLGSAAGSGAALLWRGTRETVAPMLAWVADVLVRLFEPILERLDQPSVRRPLAIMGAIASAACLGRSYLVAFDMEAKIAGVIGVLALTLVLLPIVFSRALGSSIAGALEPVSRALSGALNRSRRLLPKALAAGSVVALVLAGAWTIWPTLQRSAVIETSSIARTDANVVEGRATALSGDSLRIGATALKLAGIEAPERDQLCGRPDGRTWRCGGAARDAMARVLRSGAVTCTLTGEVEGGVSLATCNAGRKDVAHELVRNGHVFAVAAIFSGYGSVESEAKAARIGIWFGEALRPADYRAQKWDEAKRQAPDGCPIKGQVAGQSRVYVLPWASSYDRVKVREARGERWFCSEAEAQAAGWRPTERS